MKEGTNEKKAGSKKEKDAGKEGCEQGRGQFRDLDKFRVELDALVGVLECVGKFEELGVASSPVRVDPRRKSRVVRVALDRLRVLGDGVRELAFFEVLVAFGLGCKGQLRVDVPWWWRWW